MLGLLVWLLNDMERILEGNLLKWSYAIKQRDSRHKGLKIQVIQRIPEFIQESPNTLFVNVRLLSHQRVDLDSLSVR